MKHAGPCFRDAAFSLLLACSAATAARAETCPGNPGALGTSRTISVGAPQSLRVGWKTYPQTIALEPGEVILTFDDGPIPATTPAVLDALRHECVRATFFVIGRNSAAAPALVAREIRDGHTVGHHTFSHPAVTMRGLTPAAARADIDRGFQADDRAAYGDAGPEPRVPFFRFPGFADTPDLLDWLGDRHIAVFGADLWASDWVERSPQATLDLLMGRLKKAGKGIILLHDARHQTAAMIPQLLVALKAGGYRVVHIVPGAAAPPLEAAPAGWTSETEAIIRRTLGGAKGASKPKAGAPAKAPDRAHAPAGTVAPL